MVNEQKFFATMKSSYTQMKKAPGLLSVILVIALLNGALAAMSSLIPIVMAGNRSTMIIANYSFTIAVVGVVVSCGSILGSILGPKLFKNKDIFFVTILAIVLSTITTASTLFANIFAILPVYFSLAAITSTASLKMQQWLVSTIDQKILASSVGLLNTILMAVAPLMTTTLTTVSGFGNVKYALFALLAIEIVIFFVAIRMTVKAKLQKSDAAVSVD